MCVVVAGYGPVVCSVTAAWWRWSLAFAECWLVVGPQGVARLAPLYDIWSCKPYDPQYARSHAMAMSAIKDKRVYAAQDPAMWRATARAIGVDINDAPERADADCLPRTRSIPARCRRAARDATHADAGHILSVVPPDGRIDAPGWLPAVELAGHRIDDNHFVDVEAHCP